MSRIIQTVKRLTAPLALQAVPPIQRFRIDLQSPFMHWIQFILTLGSFVLALLAL